MKKKKRKTKVNSQNDCKKLGKLSANTYEFVFRVNLFRINYETSIVRTPYTSNESLTQLASLSSFCEIVRLYTGRYERNFHFPKPWDTELGHHFTNIILSD